MINCNNIYQKYGWAVSIELGCHRLLYTIRKKDQLIGSFEYLIFKINNNVLMATAIEFAIIMTKSFIPTP